MHREDVHAPSGIETEFVDPHASYADSEDERERSCGFSKSITFTNSLAKPVIVTDRDGFSFRVDNNKLAKKAGFFIVYVRYNIPRGVNINTNGLLNVDDSEITPELKAIKAALQKEQISQQSSRVVATQFQIAYRFPSDMFKTNRGAVHLMQLGLTVHYADDKRNIVNPDSKMGKQLNLLHVSAIPGMNMRIEINDPDTVHGHRYINVLNRIFKIETTIDKSKLPGIYTYASEPSVEGEVPVFYDFATADDSLGLYKTIEDARSYGNMKAAREREYEDLKHAQKLEQAEAAQEGILLKHFIEKLTTLNEQRDSTAKQFQQMEAQLGNSQRLMFEELQKFQKQMTEERESERRRDHEIHKRRVDEEYERRAAERKDTTEMLKWSTAVVTGFVTLAFTITKLTK